MPDLPANFCVASFVQLTTHPSGSFSPCPYLGGTTWRGQYQSIMDSWRSEDMESLRKQFLQGQRPEICNRCWHEEDHGKKSLRQRLYDPETGHSDYAVINRGHMIEDMVRGLEARRYLQGPKILTIKNGNVCNAKCRSCHPGDSSRWIEDARKLQIALDQSFYQTDQQEKNWSQAQLDEVLAMSPGLQRLELFGGEPLYNKRVIDLLRTIIQAGHGPHISLYINTNGSVDLIDRVPEIVHFREIEIGVSLDAVGKKFSYVRHGLDYDQVLSNIRRWQHHLHEHKVNYFIDSITTVSVLNILDLPGIKAEVMSLLPQSPFWNLLINPDWLFIKNLPDSAKQRARQVLGQDPEFQDLLRVIDQPADPQAWERFLLITDSLDQIRQEDWRQTFPDLADAVG